MSYESLYIHPKEFNLLIPPENQLSILSIELETVGKVYEVQRVPGLQARLITSDHRAIILDWTQIDATVFTTEHRMGHSLYWKIYSHVHIQD